MIGVASGSWKWLPGRIVEINSTQRDRFVLLYKPSADDLFIAIAHLQLSLPTTSVVA
jgi:hypothetical protein